MCMDLRKDVPLAVKSNPFQINTWPRDPETRENLAHIWTRNFSLDFAFNISDLRE